MVGDLRVRVSDCNAIQPLLWTTKPAPILKKRPQFRHCRSSRRAWSASMLPDAFVKIEDVIKQEDASDSGCWPLGSTSHAEMCSVRKTRASVQVWARKQHALRFFSLQAQNASLFQHCSSPVTVRQRSDVLGLVELPRSQPICKPSEWTHASPRRVHNQDRAQFPLYGSRCARVTRRCSLGVAWRTSSHFAPYVALRCTTPSRVSAVPSKAMI